MDKITKMIFCLFLAAILSPVFADEWKASVVKNLDALVSSCIVLPCTFTYPKNNLPSSKLRGIWHVGQSKDDRVYHEDRTRIMENYRGRTRMLGRLGENNCTLEMTEIKDHDNGPFCFRIEIAENDKATTQKFSFVEDCAELKMIHEPKVPKLTHKETAVLGSPYTISCRVLHTCPSYPPSLQWSKDAPDKPINTHTEIVSGVWAAESILTITPKEEDDHEEVTCTAAFHGYKTSSAKLKLYVKRTENYNHIIIPSVVGIAITVVFGVVCVFMVKKYKQRIADLQSQDGSMFNRLSRLSRRFRSDGPGPIRSDQRRSIWSRFSRRPRRDVGDVGEIPKNSNQCANQKIAKPRFPSPKSQKKSCNYEEDLGDGDDYMNTADLNVYGNI